MFKYGGFQNKTKWLMTFFVQGARPHGNIAAQKKRNQSVRIHVKTTLPFYDKRYHWRIFISIRACERCLKKFAPALRNWQTAQWSKQSSFYNF